MKNKVLVGLCVLFGLMMVNAGANKLFGYIVPQLTPDQLVLQSAFETLKWIMPLVAVVEILGGVLIAIPKTRVLGALIILPVMIGIVIHHAVFEPATIAISLVMLVINVVVIVDNKDKFLPIVS